MRCANFKDRSRQGTVIHGIAFNDFDLAGCRLVIERGDGNGC